MKIETISKILKAHSVPCKVENGRIYADSMLVNTEEFEIIVDVTEYSKSELFEFLGY